MKTYVKGLLVCGGLVLAGSCAKQPDPYKGREPKLADGQTPASPPPVAPGPTPAPERQESSPGAPTAPAYDWRLDIQWTEVGTRQFHGNDYGSAQFREIAEHGELATHNDPATTIHQTVHEIHSLMRGRKSGAEAFIYLENGKGAYLAYPAARLSDVKTHIGASFRSLAPSAFDTYLVKQNQVWKNPLYLLDEWRAMAAGARTSLEVEASGQWTPAFSSVNHDPLADLVAMMYFAGATIRVIESSDSNYLAARPEFKAIIAMLVEESVDILNQARETNLGQSSVAFTRLDNLRSSDDAGTVREAFRRLLGDQWVAKHLNF